ncbi:hypothetical protein KC343_g3713 [Hortaea werneckii]|nr:hypothetical protein KC352_g8196 [Hortaea werneckii]KAI7568957.1 hypothetical protein KC317_g3734 [Hortaea werneckii]KAI7616175.1 hypothetical protein KC346_g6134 [Hortaea werneckii]KAI7632003.1 hypothetical protein KC343_g3713 [Hortaea werneckii]KAI7677283.1 hypothetical protein KC319_g3979 [Hortaea werneckii]
MENTFPIMDLPAELRTIIYEFVVLDSGIKLDMRRRSRRSPCTYPFTSTSGLLLTSKTVHREFSGALYKVATSAAFPTAEIQASVCDYNFAKIYDPLDWMPQALRTIVRLKIKHVNLSFTNLKSMFCNESFDRFAVWGRECGMLEVAARYTFAGAISGEDEGLRLAAIQRSFDEKGLSRIHLEDWYERSLNGRIKILSAILGE